MPLNYTFITIRNILKKTKQESKWNTAVQIGEKGREWKNRTKFRTVNPAISHLLRTILVLEVVAQWHSHLLQTVASDMPRAGSPQKAWHKIKQLNRWPGKAEWQGQGEGKQTGLLKIMLCMYGGGGRGTTLRMIDRSSSQGAGKKSAFVYPLSQSHPIISSKHTGICLEQVPLRPSWSMVEIQRLHSFWAPHILFHSILPTNLGNG